MASTDPSSWSHEAMLRHKHRAPGRAEMAAWRMEQGPRLLDDGYTLAVPSEPGWYDPEASGFWRSQGFRWDRENCVWRRDTRRPHKGKVYAPEAWLRAARRKYDEFFPLRDSGCDPNRNGGRREP